jgi:hypothetical protein
MKAWNRRSVVELPVTGALQLVPEFELNTRVPPE